MTALGYSLRIDEARRTVSKYITGHAPGSRGSFKVRFSHHKPIKHRDLSEDCDVFVGWTQTGLRATQQAIEAVDAHFTAKGVRA